MARETKPATTEQQAENERLQASQDGKTELEKATGESGEEQVQSAVDAELEQGFRGVKTDPRPNEDYTIAGVTKNLKR